MSRPRPRAAGHPRPTNLGVLLRDAFLVLNDQVVARLAERGHGVVRAAHGNVFQYLDDSGTSVSQLAERAQMTKQAMSELVAHLEVHGYVVREPDPSDRRAKLVLPTKRGREVVAVAQAVVPELEAHVEQAIGSIRLRQLRADLETICRAAAPS